MNFQTMGTDCYHSNITLRGTVNQTSSFYENDGENPYASIVPEAYWLVM